MGIFEIVLKVQEYFLNKKNQRFLFKIKGKIIFEFFFLKFRDIYKFFKILNVII